MSKNRQTLWLKDRGRKWLRNYFLAALIARVQRIGAGGARLPSKSKTNQRVVKREKGLPGGQLPFLCYGIVMTLTHCVLWRVAHCRFLLY